MRSPSAGAALARAALTRSALACSVFTCSALACSVFTCSALACSALAALAAGCAPSSSLPVDVPAAVTRVGTVRADAVDVPRAASGLHPAGGGEQVFFTERDRPWMMFGYHDAALARFTLPGAETLAATPVRPAREDEPCWRLPIPSWSAALDPSAEGRSIPPLTTSWAKQCPASTASPKSWFDVRCRDMSVHNCGNHPVADDAQCLAALIEVECPGSATRVAIEADGRACPIEAERPTSCRSTTGPEGDPRWVCANSCTIDFYRPRPPPFVVDSVEVGAPNAGTNPADDLDNIRLINLAGGSIDALGVSGDLVLAAVRSPASPSIGFCYTELRDVAHHQVKVDAETLVRTGSISLGGRCVTRMIPDPVGGGLLAGFHVGTDVGVARIDRDGRWVDEQMLPRALPAQAKDVYQVPAILTSSGTIVLIEQVNSITGDGFSFVHLIDLETLQPDPALPVRTYPGSAFAAEWIDDARYVLLRRGSDAVTITTVRGEPAPSLGFMLPSARAISAARIGAGRVLFADVGLSKSLVLADMARPGSERVVGVSRVFERTSIPIEIRLLGGDRPSYGVVSALFSYDVGGPELQSALAAVAIDGDDVRALPGLFELTLPGGARWHGAVLHLQPDGRGRVWGMAPWVGRLVRVTLP